MVAISIAVDSSAIVTKREYYLWYKGIYIRYVKNINEKTGLQNIAFSDSVIAFCGDRNDVDSTYRLTCEFLRAWAYQNELNINLSTGMIISNVFAPKQLRDACGTFVEPRRCNLYRSFVENGEFLYIPNIDTDEKSEVLRLYTDAKSNFNIYFRILFLWHTLAYPDNTEQKAIRFVDSYVEKLEQIEGRKSGYYIKQFITGPFGYNEHKKKSKNKCLTVGEYTKEYVRNAIAHIVRYTGFESILLDNLEQRRFLEYVAWILDGAAKDMLDNDYKFTSYATINTFRIINPEIEFH